MAGTSTVFTDQVTLIVAAWLNDINNTCYTALGSGGATPTTAAQVLSNIGGAGASGTLTANNPIVGNGTNSLKAVATLPTSVISGYLQGYWPCPPGTVYAGSATNALVLTPTVPMPAYTYGNTLLVTMPVGQTNTTTMTVNVSGLGAVYIQNNGAALVANQMIAQSGYWLVCDGTGFQMININNQPTALGKGIFFGPVTSSGAGANAIVVANTPPLLSLFTGATVDFIANAATTGACTFAPDGLTAKALQINGLALQGGEVQSGVRYTAKYDGTAWQLSGGFVGGAVSWTPVVKFGATAASSNVATGSYERVGSYIFYSFHVDVSNKNSGTGSATITGFPFTSNAANPLSVNKLAMSISPATGAVADTAYCALGTAVFTLTKASTTGGAAALVADTDVTTGSLGTATVFYSSGFVRV